MNKRTIVVVTNFSASSANALSYACKFARDYELNILLAHIYSIPPSYAAEGLSITTINDAIIADDSRLLDELAIIRHKYPHLHIEAKMITGNFLESLDEIKREVDPALFIIGAVGQYADLWQWDEDWLTALTTVSSPVMVIPQHIAYSPISRIAFAADDNEVQLPDQASAIKKLVRLSNAGFYVVHVSAPYVGGLKKEYVGTYKEVFMDLKPQYHNIENKSVIIGLAEFIQQHQIDLLIVVPHKHGLWHSLFNKSYTKQLALLNHLPVLAIHENN